MLELVYTASPFPYFTYDGPVRFYTGSSPSPNPYTGPWDIGGIDYGGVAFPFVEEIQYLDGIFAMALYTAPNVIAGVTLVTTPTTNSYVFALVTSNVNFWPSWLICLHYWDGRSGVYLGRIIISPPTSTLDISDEVQIAGFTISKSGVMYFIYYTGFNAPYLLGYSLSAFTATGSSIAASTYTGLDAWNHPCVDDINGFIVDGNGYSVSVWDFTTGVLLYNYTLPGRYIASCLAEGTTFYALCDNRILVLIDYGENKVLGSARVNVQSDGKFYWSTDNIEICWDQTYNRLLMMRQVANNSDGSDATVINGYLVIPFATRLTTPIPLVVPRVGRTIPVMCQLVGDINEGVSGGVVNPITISGGGELTLETVSMDSFGRSNVLVDCETAGSCTLTCSVTQPD